MPLRARTCPTAALRAREAGAIHIHTHTYTHTYIHTHTHTYHCGPHHVGESGRTILGRRPPPQESLNRRRISHSHSLYSHSHLRGRWTNCLIRTPSVERPNRTFALLLVRSCQVQSPKSKVSNSRSSAPDLTHLLPNGPDPGPGSTIERASHAPVIRLYPRGTAGFRSH